MIIISQKEDFTTNFTGECWVAQNGNEGYLIVHKGSIRPYLGTYKDEKRAIQILKEIFDSFITNKKSYKMPSN